MASQLSLQKAAQAWHKPETQHIQMDYTLAIAFAEVLDDIWSKPWLGNATTGELIEELKFRCQMNGTINYKTVGREESASTPDALRRQAVLLPRRKKGDTQ